MQKGKSTSALQTVSQSKDKAGKGIKVVFLRKGVRVIHIFKDMDEVDENMHKHIDKDTTLVEVYHDYPFSHS